MKYNESHAWTGGDYFGASLQSWVNYFGNKYILICCNMVGTNAFFVRTDLSENFTKRHPLDLYRPARYELLQSKLCSNHSATLMWLNQKIWSNKELTENKINNQNVLIAQTHYGKMHVYSNDQIIGKSLLVTGKFQEKIISDVLIFIKQQYNFKPEIFVDIGANIGTHTIYALSSCGFNKALCFEPDKLNYRLLCLNLLTNNHSVNTIAYPVALSNESRMVELELSNSNYGDHRIKATSTKYSFGEESERGYSTAQAITLDGLITHRDDWSKALVWLDTQGHEGNIFKGGEKFLASERGPKYIVTEFWPYGIERSSSKEFYFEFLKSCFSIYNITTCEDTKFEKLTINELESIYHIMLNNSEKNVHPHTDLLLVTK